MNDYIQGKINLDQLFALAEFKGKKVAEISEVEKFLNNSFLISVIADENNVTEKHIKNKVSLLYKKLLGEK